MRAGPGVTADLLPCRLAIRVGYDLQGGDGVENWHRFDFDLGDQDGDLEVEVEAASVVERGGNRLRVDLEEPGFRVRLAGFDVNRDLDVRVDARWRAGP